jgi:hypothetical protein
MDAQCENVAAVLRHGGDVIGLQLGGKLPDFRIVTGQDFGEDGEHPADGVGQIAGVVAGGSWPMLHGAIHRIQPSHWR